MGVSRPARLLALLCVPLHPPRLNLFGFCCRRLVGNDMHDTVMGNASLEQRPYHLAQGLHLPHSCRRHRYSNARQFSHFPQTLLTAYPSGSYEYSRCFHQPRLVQSISIQHSQYADGYEGVQHRINNTLHRNAV
jgi:hypothetical protein